VGMSEKFAKAIAATIVTLMFATGATAGEPRPWLCRDKPAFSDSHPMQYEVSAKRGEWQIFFMQLETFTGGESRGSHDGFTILQSRDVTRTPQAGNLPSGQYYAVALYRKGGAWICSYGDEASHGPGEIKKLCYGPEDDSSCPATLSVKSQAP
jgi:hypothetical protein